MTRPIVLVDFIHPLQTFVSPGSKAFKEDSDRLYFSRDIELIDSSVYWLNGVRACHPRNRGYQS